MRNRGLDVTVWGIDTWGLDMVQGKSLTAMNL